MRLTAQNGQPRQGVYPAGAVVLLLTAITRQSEPSSFGKRTRKPNSVYAVIPLGAALPRALVSDLPGGSGHCLTPLRRRSVAGSPAWSSLSAPGRRRARTLLRVRTSLPIWSCSVWGLPCLRHYCRSGALLPHLFTLTPAGLAVHANLSGHSGDPPKRGSRGGMFSVALAVREPLRSRPGRYPAHCPAEFGLSSPGNPCPPWRRRISGSDRPVLLPASSVPRISVCVQPLASAVRRLATIKSGL